MAPSVSLPMKPHVCRRTSTRLQTVIASAVPSFTWDKVAGANAYVVEARVIVRISTNCTSAKHKLHANRSGLWREPERVDCCHKWLMHYWSCAGRCGRDRWVILGTVVIQWYSLNCNIYSGIEICTYKKVLWHGIRWRYYTLSLYLPL